MLTCTLKTRLPCKIRWRQKIWKHVCKHCHSLPAANLTVSAADQSLNIFLTYDVCESSVLYFVYDCAAVALRVVNIWTDVTGGGTALLLEGALLNQVSLMPYILLIVYLRTLNKINSLNREPTELQKKLLFNNQQTHRVLNYTGTHQFISSILVPVRDVTIQ